MGWPIEGNGAVIRLLLHWNGPPFKRYYFIGRSNVSCPVKNTTVFPSQQCLEYEFKTTPKQFKSGHVVDDVGKISNSSTAWNFEKSGQCVHIVAIPSCFFLKVGGGLFTGFPHGLVLLLKGDNANERRSWNCRRRPLTTREWNDFDTKRKGGGWKFVPSTNLSSYPSLLGCLAVCVLQLVR